MMSEKLESNQFEMTSSKNKSGLKERIAAFKEKLENPLKILFTEKVSMDVKLKEVEGRAIEEGLEIIQAQQEIIQIQRDALDEISRTKARENEGFAKLVNQTSSYAQAILDKTNKLLGE